MSVRYYCDPCGQEIKDTANRSIFTVDRSAGDTSWPDVKVTVDVMVSIDDTTNAGHICVDCVKRVVAEGLCRKANR